MTVVLVGIGADGENVNPRPPVSSTGEFEYIPIPERSQEGTVETTTFGTWNLRYRDGTAADYLNHIDPASDSDRRKTGEALRNWPVHHDPNFQAWTYGESDGRPKYLQELRKLQHNDVLTFYTGLDSEDTHYLNRYIIGYFTVDEVIDFQNLNADEYGGKTAFHELDSDERTALLEKHPNNAHVKRFRATGTINEGMMIVTGKRPSRLLDRAFRISEYRSGGHRLTNELESKFNPLTSSGDKNAYLGGFKQAHALGVDVDEFRSLIDA